MPPEFNTTNRRLVIRYASAPNYSLNQIRITANDQGVYDLAEAILSVQNEPAERISTVVTRQLF